MEVGFLDSQLVILPVQAIDQVAKRQEDLPGTALQRRMNTAWQPRTSLPAGWEYGMWQSFRLLRLLTNMQCQPDGEKGLMSIC